MTFHCHVFGVFMSTSRPLAGAPSEFPKQPSHGSTVVSSLRMPVSVVTNGGLVAMFNTGLRRSRWKNWPTPPRRAVFPVPKISQAIPTRGAMLFLSCVISERFGPFVPPTAPASSHQFLSGGSTNPLQESAPSAGLKSDGTKLVILSSVVYGL